MCQYKHVYQIDGTMKTRILIVIILALSAAAPLFSQAGGSDTNDLVWSHPYGVDNIYDVKFSVNDSLIICAQFGKLFILNAFTGEKLREREYPESTPLKISVHPDGTRFIYNCIDDILELDINTLDTIRIYRHQGPYMNDYDGIMDMAYSADGSKIVSVTWDGRKKDNIYIWDTETGELIKQFGDGYNGNFTATSDNGEYFVVATSYFNNAQDKWITMVNLYSMGNYELIREIGEYSQSIEDMSFSHDSKYLVIAGWDTSAVVWDVEHPEIEKRYVHKTTDFSYEVRNSAFTYDNKYLVTCGGTKGAWTTRIWDRENQELLYEYSSPLCGSLGFDISKDDNSFIASNTNAIFFINNKMLNTDVFERTEKQSILYPNPTTNITNITYNQLKPEIVNISIYDLNSHKVAELFNGFLDIGEHTFYWDAGEFPAGVYFCRITGEGLNQTLKIIVE